MRRFVRRLLARIRYRDAGVDLQQEMDVHRAMAEDALRASGATADDARWQASRQMGNVLLARETSRAIWIAPWLESIWQDLRYGARSLRHSPGFAVTALLTLALGVGVNTVLFSLANALLLRPWRAPEAHALVLAYHRTDPGSGGRLVGISAPELAFLRQHATTVNIAGIRQIGGPVTSGATTRPAIGRLVSSNYFDVLEVPVIIGRGLTGEDDQPDRPLVIILGHDLWRAAFSSDPGIVGRTIAFRNVAVTVVGVAGQDVRESPFSGAPELWLPLRAMPLLFPEETFAQEFMANPGHCCVDLVGRLQPGANRARAEAELSVLDRQFRRAAERDSQGMRVTGTEAVHDPEMTKALPVFALLFTAVSLVLLLTAANVGNLQLARAAARRRDMTVRMALGAGRWRVVRQLLTEGLVLSAAATSLCLAVSSTAARALMARMDPSTARALDFSIDTRVLLFATGVTVATALVTSLAPALRGTRQLVAGRTSDRSGLRLRSTFLAAQVAISVVLLFAAVLLSRALAQAASQDVGFRLDTLMAMHVDRQSQGQDDDRAFLRDVMTALGDRHVAAAVAEPLGDASFHTGVRRADEPEEADRPARFQPVSSNYFDVLGIPLRVGRAFSDASPDEVVLNETLARILWPEGDAIGNHLAGANGTIGRRVVGIVADAHLAGLARIEPTIFQPARELTYLLFGRDVVAVEELRAIVSRLDPRAAVAVRAVGDNVGASLEAATMGARVAGGLGLLALAVSAIGIAGVFSFAVTERRREIGIRLALGASPQRVSALLLRQSGRPVVFGLLIGVLMAALAGPALRSYLYGLSPSDPPAYAAVVLVVVVIAWTATLLPLRRALRIDPAVTLRHE